MGQGSLQPKTFRSTGALTADAPPQSPLLSRRDYFYPPTRPSAEPPRLRRCPCRGSEPQTAPFSSAVWICLIVSAKLPREELPVSLIPRRGMPRSGRGPPPKGRWVGIDQFRVQYKSPLPRLAAGFVGYTLFIIWRGCPDRLSGRPRWPAVPCRSR